MSRGVAVHIQDVDGHLAARRQLPGARRGLTWEHVWPLNSVSWASRGVCVRPLLSCSACSGDNRLRVVVMSPRMRVAVCTSDFSSPVSCVHDPAGSNSVWNGHVSCHHSELARGGVCGAISMSDFDVSVACDGSPCDAVSVSWHVSCYSVWASKQCTPQPKSRCCHKRHIQKSSFEHIMSAH